MKASTPEAYKLFHDGALILSQIEQNGIRVDTELLNATIEKVNKKIRIKKAKLEKTEVWKLWQEEFGRKAKISSGPQLAHILYNKMGVKPTRFTAKGSDEDLGFGKRDDGKYNKPSTSEKALQDVNHPFVRDLFTMKEYEKTGGTFLKGIRRETMDGILHPFFHLHSTRTYRSSSSDPNFHNFPKRDETAANLVRSVFIPREGMHFWETDFKGCFVGETLVETIDGPREIKSIVDGVNSGEKIYVYGYDHQKQRVSVSFVTKGAITGRNVEVWKVVLDNGEEIVATKNHNFIKRDGSFVELRDLDVGDSLMPFYKKNKRGKKKDGSKGVAYIKIYLNNGQSMLAHNLIVMDVYNTRITQNGLVVHHIDGNGINNSLNNLKLMTRSEHMRIHSLQGWDSKPNESAGRDFSYQKSDEFKSLMRELNKRRREEWTEKDWEEWHKRMMEGKKRAGPNVGEKNGRYGKPCSDEVKRNISNGRKGKGLGKWLKKVVCEICKQEFVALHVHLRQIHKLTLKEYKETYNHKVVNVEFVGRADVYNITVEGFHTYALSAGVIVKNCEVAVASVVTGDKALKAYVTDKSKDMHKDTGADIFMLHRDLVTKKLRHISKNQFVFAEFYGSYYKQTAKDIWESVCREKDLLLADGTHIKAHLAKRGIKEGGTFDPEIETKKGTFEHHIKEVERIFWYERFPGYTQWKRDWYEQFQKNGGFYTKTGFWVGGPMSKNAVLNYPVQGPAFHCLLWFLIRLQKWLKKNKMRTTIVGQIHDSCEGNSPPDEIQDVLGKVNELVSVDLPKSFPWVTVPMSIEVSVADIGKSWSDMKEWIDVNGVWRQKPEK